MLMAYQIMHLDFSDLFSFFVLITVFQVQKCVYLFQFVLSYSVLLYSSS